MKYSINSLAMVMWGLNIPYIITESGRFNVIVGNDQIDITDYNKTQLKEFFTTVLEIA